MCSFVKVHGDIESLACIEKDIFEMLEVKGGDEYNAVINYNGFLSRVDANSADDLKNSVKTILNKLKYSDTVIISYFSRLIPEMEELGNPSRQPYTNTNEQTTVMVHGTIPNAELIAKKHGFDINVDTEIFNHLPFDIACDETEKAGGKISAISIVNLTDETSQYQNGLGLFRYNYLYKGNIVIIDSNIRTKNFKLVENYIIQPHLDDVPITVALFSGGLDITCSVQKQLLENKSTDLKLWYFDWGTNAAKGEIKAGRNFAKTIKTNSNFVSKDLIVEHNIIKIEPMFRSILSACEITSTRLIDPDATGAGSHEAEADISYVPYRNTFLITLAAARAEQLYPGKRIEFVIGANLSEGMIYLDNSETWLRRMNSLVKVGGQRTANFSVVAPYVNRTKTSMIQDAEKNNFDISNTFSCYFPIGLTGKEECGKCGSCLLKINALKRK